MTEFTRDTMPAVPEGKVRLWGFGNGSLPSGMAADRTPVASAIGALHGYPTVTLAHETRGYVPAGSCARWQEAIWSVTWWESNGTCHGKNFAEANEAAARAYFADITDPQKVSARRQEDAMLEDTVYRPAREQRAREAAERLAADKARKAALRKARRVARLATA